MVIVYVMYACLIFVTRPVNEPFGRKFINFSLFNKRTKMNRNLCSLSYLNEHEHMCGSFSYGYVCSLMFIHYVHLLRLFMFAFVFIQIAGQLG